MKKIPLIVTGIIIIIVIILAIVWYNRESRSMLSIQTFEECADNGYPIMESYPRQCKTPDGRNFVEIIVVSQDMITVTTPQPNQTVSSPLSVRGEAIGPWYFEASFPVRLLDGNGVEIAVVPAQAQGEWMTTNKVPFSATLTFTPPATPTGTLVFQKDNPSGLPENDAEIRIPVVFAITTAGGGGTELAQCRPTGCSGQICSDEDMASTCEYRPQYACYKTATCARQSDGHCGWTQTPALVACIANPPAE